MLEFRNPSLFVLMHNSNKRLFLVPANIGSVTLSVEFLFQPMAVTRWPLGMNK